MAWARRKQELFLLAALALAVAVLAQSSWSFSQGPNARNASVDTFVNITGSAPEILRVSMPPAVTLTAGGTTIVECNVSVRDYNGYADISAVNATLFASALGAADDNNTHYTNASCAAVAGQLSGAFANYTCTFPVAYYAVNGSWNCTAFVNDTINLRNNNSNATVVNALLALNVTALIDYGDLAVGDTSDDVPANVSNAGNRPINITVRGYGRTLGDGLGLVCEQGNLTVDLQRFAANASSAYGEKQVLGSAPGQVFGLTIPKATNASGSLNTTYWQLYLSPAQNAFGLCNGTIVFQAEAG